MDLKGLNFILQTKEKDKHLKGKQTYDIIIIGGGPAGLTAAVYAARKKLNTLLVSKDLGGQVLLTAHIENYIGYQYITGKELTDKFQEQIKQFPVDLIIGEEVEKLLPAGRWFEVITKGNKKFVGKAVIVASGKRSRALNVPGEKELVGRGVSYCATCDAPLFAERDVAVIGGGNSGLQAVIDLDKVAKKIYVVDIASSWQADAVLVEKMEKSDKLEALLGYEVMEMKGENRVRGIVIKSRETEEMKELPVEGVFIEIGVVPNSEFVQGLLEINDAGEIVVDCACRTNMSGIFAAGDVTTVPAKQIIVAAGEGAKAALSAYEYLLKRH